MKNTKIENLTEEQTSKFPQYVKKWIEIGINTDMPDKESTKKIVNSFRELIGMSHENVPLVMTKNPIEAWVVCCLWELGIKAENLLDEMKAVFNGNPKGHDIPEASLPYQTGSFFVSVFSFYDYMLEELKIPIDKDLYVKYKKWEQTSQIGCIYPLKDISVLCDKPITIKINEKNVLHCDGGPALEYAGEGDFKTYALNGVIVPEYLAITPSSQLDISLYSKETNADVKAEFVRKIGIEKMLEHGELEDTYTNYDKKEYDWWYKSEYQLWNMKNLFPSLERAPFVKMLNPTTKIWHMEGVSPECKNLTDAIRERFGGRDFVIKNMA